MLNNKKIPWIEKTFNSNSSFQTIVLAHSIITSLYYLNYCDNHEDNQFLANWLSKTYSTSSLTYYTYLRRKKKFTALTVGLCAHTIGDSLLAANNQELLKSIPFFMLGHLFYTYELSKQPFIKPATLLPKRKNKIIALCTYATLINAMLHNYVDEQLQVAIPIYTLALLSTALMESLLQKQELSLFIGLFNYILSDSLIAINTFIVEIPHDNKISWFLYYSSQLLISNTLINNHNIANTISTSQSNPPAP